MSGTRSGRWSTIGLVVGREVRERTRTRAFRWGTGVMLALVAALAVLPSLLPDGDDPAWTVAVVGQHPAGFEAQVEAAARPHTARVDLQRRAGDPDRIAREDGVDAVLVEGGEVVSEGRLPPRLREVLTVAAARSQVVDGLRQLGVDPERAAELLSVEPLAVRTLEGDDQGARDTVASLGSVILFIAIVTYGSWVQYSVLEEKANRVVEIVVSAVRPADLLAGKVLAMGTVGLGQLLLLVGVGAGAGAAAGTLPDLPGFVPAAVAWSLVWFVLGFAFYAVAYAAAGALTTRQEDAQSAAMPILTVAMTAYFVSFVAVASDPHGALARVMSLLPPAAPLAMPARAAAGGVAAWEMAAAVVLMVLSIVGVVAAAGRIYQRALLHSSARVRLSQLWRLRRS